MLWMSLFTSALSCAGKSNNFLEGITNNFCFAFFLNNASKREVWCGDLKDAHFGQHGG